MRSPWAPASGSSPCAWPTSSTASCTAASPRPACPGPCASPPTRWRSGCWGSPGCTGCAPASCWWTGPTPTAAGRASRRRCRCATPRSSTRRWARARSRWPWSGPSTSGTAAAARAGATARTAGSSWSPTARCAPSWSSSASPTSSSAPPATRWAPCWARSPWGRCSACRWCSSASSSWSPPCARRRPDRGPPRTPRPARPPGSAEPNPVAAMGAGHHHHHDHGHPGHAHDHARAGRDNARRLAVTLALQAAYLVAEVVGGYLANSLSLLADAGHMLSDVAALALSLFAVWIAQKPATARRTFGWYRTEILAALANAATLIAISIYIFWEAAQRLRSPEPVEGLIVMWVAVGGLLVNGVGAALLHGGREHSLTSAGR